MNWTHGIRAYAGHGHKSPYGSLVLETRHRGQSSVDAEVAAFRNRMKRGEISYIEVISFTHPIGMETIRQ